MRWTDEMDEILIAGRREGKTGSEIAALVADLSGQPITRSMVMGRAMRLRVGLAPRTRQQTANLHKRRMTVMRKPPPKVKRTGPALVPAYIPEQDPFDVGRVPFIETSARQCRFIPGDPKKDSRVCGLKTRPGLVWCEAHARRVYPNLPPMRTHTEPTDSPASETVA